MKEVTAVLPARNCRPWLIKCLKALSAGTMVPEIIVVDDGSEDGTSQMVKKYWPAATLLTISAHTGYAHAANAGLRLVRTEYAFLIRPDLRPGKHCIENLLGAVKAGTGSKKKDDGAGGVFCAVPLFVRERGAGGRLKADGSLIGKNRETLVVRDGCAMYRMKALEEIGWFDERHFDGLEAFDLSLRAALYGYRTVEAAGAKVRPFAFETGGQEADPEAPSHTDTFHRQLAAGNSAYVFYKNLTPLQRVLGLPLYALADLAAAGSFAGSGESAEYRMALTRGRALCSLESERRLALDEGVSVYPENLPDASFLGMDEQAEGIYPLFLAEKEFFAPGRMLRYLHIQGLLTRDFRKLIRLFR